MTDAANMPLLERKEKKRKTPTNHYRPKACKQPKCLGFSDTMALAHI
jgi:hypothetical protein